VIQPSKSQPGGQAVASISHLQQVWESGGFAFTLQLSLPSSLQRLKEQIPALLKKVDAVLVADAPGGVVALSSVARAVLLRRAGFWPIVQLSGRDRNRIALQSDLLGLGALKLPDVLIDMKPITRASLGQNSDARLVVDLDGPELLAAAARLRDNARFLSGASIKTPPFFYLGALIDLENPLPAESIEAAQFLVTEPVTSLENLAEALPSFVRASQDLLQVRPLLVSVPFAISSDRPNETSVDSLLAMFHFLQESNAVRGWNIVVSDSASLGALEHLASAGLLSPERPG
jgi:hypothetical protein